jgi:poly-gamma-glutamate synthesis protein (capsule biosynthesis protein)
MTKPPSTAIVALSLLVCGIFLFAIESGIFVVRSHASEGLTAVRPVSSSQSAAEPVTLLAVGDIMLGRNVETLMGEFGADYPFAKVHSLLSGSDMTLGNLEGPIVEDHMHTPNLSFQFSFSPSVAPVLKSEHISIVSLANNHTFNYGEQGFEDTEKILDQSGVAHFGNPNTYSDSYVARKTVNGQPFIFVGFDTVDIPFDPTAADSFVKGIARTPGDFLIVMPHGGIEYSLHSNEFQESFYRSLIDSGADVVIGAHPHVVEEIEEYHGHLIFYSLGNFIFDQYFSKEVQQELSVQLAISSSSVQYNLLPLLSVQSQPALMSGSAKAAFLADVASTSSHSIQQSIENGSITLPRGS